VVAMKEAGCKKDPKVSDPLSSLLGPTKYINTANWQFNSLVCSTKVESGLEVRYVPSLVCTAAAKPATAYFSAAREGGIRPGDF